MASTKSYTISKVSNFKKIASIIVFFLRIWFFLAHLHFKCKLKNPKWYSIKQEWAIFCEQIY